MPFGVGLLAIDVQCETTIRVTDMTGIPLQATPDTFPNELIVGGLFFRNFLTQIQIPQGAFSGGNTLTNAFEISADWAPNLAGCPSLPISIVEACSTANIEVIPSPLQGSGGDELNFDVFIDSDTVPIGDVCMADITISSMGSQPLTPENLRLAGFHKTRRKA
ncbi:MAG: hypothetical protein V3U27_00215 [Candidatus Tectomicrobia bacterium]